MLRKNIIKAIAVILALFGIYGVVYSIVSIFVLLSKNQGGLYSSISVPFLLYASINLFQLKESGRKVALALFLIQIGINLIVLAWGLLLGIESSLGSFQFRINTLGTDYVLANSRIMFVGVMLAISFPMILAVAFLLQRETRELFSSTENSVATQPQVVP